ncbi:mucin-5B-like isoform X1 [Paroedura picta]|uniref:mucin-5B-like isoform X1 n=2 Tax=Paroedura picta TaxID=143630 RepID=UPI004056CEC7
MKRECQLWILCLLSSCCNSKTPVMIVHRPAVTASECSTWGNFHFQTFDQVKYDFPGTCQYVFASHCNDSYQDFNIQIRRSVQNRTIHFAANIDGALLEVKKSGIVVNGKEILLPFSLKSMLIEDIGAYFQVTSTLGLILKWDWSDTLLLDLEDTYRQKTCGLCGNYDGNQKNDMILNGYHLLPQQYGNLQKIEEPTEECPDVPEENKDGRKSNYASRWKEKCKSKYKSNCKKTLSSFGNCSAVADTNYYVTACTDDMCACTQKSSHSDLTASCVCSSLSQYSRDCVLKGGDPGKWRSTQLCFQECPTTLEYMECGNPCIDTCSNPERSKVCKAPCSGGCYCAKGTILDDISSKKCIPIGSCPCTYQRKVYRAGESYSTPCQICTCTEGKWFCLALPCSGNCNVERGFYITTFDKKQFIFHGNCCYVLAKDTNGFFVIIGEIVQCGSSDTMTCLKNVLITLGVINIKVCASGNVYINNVIAVLPLIKDGITLFRPSTFYVNIMTSSRIQIQVQLKPTMQVFIMIDETYRNRTSGLCGNFNNIETDDFRTVSGIVEDSASAFGNSWKIMASCADVQDIIEDPCLKSVDKANFGKHWCALLANPNGIFEKCHPVVDPAPYVKNCAYDTCNAEKSQEALCVIFSAYARSCAAKGVLLKGWRSGICDVSKECPQTMEYSYEVKFCNSSCRSLSAPDVLCNVQSAPIEGCGCPEGTYLATEEKCVSPEHCPCYYKDQMIQPGNSFQQDEFMCKCIRGQLDCIRKTKVGKDCPPSMYYFDCSSAGPGVSGSECQKSCKTQDMQCYTTECVSGCICPDGLVSDGNGTCIEEQQCPCLHEGNVYSPGTEIRVSCNTCICHKRQWNCTTNPCHGICTVYGNGHYLSFDGGKFDFMGNCDYILAQDFCPNNPQEGTFRIVVTNDACGKSPNVCALKISLILQSSEIRLSSGKMEVITNKPDTEKNYKYYIMGLYIVIETYHGMTFLWDEKTTVIIQVAPSSQGKVCGLCGDFDNRAHNDFTSRGQSVESHAQTFGNSWKVTTSCSDINKTDPYAAQPLKLALGQKQCSIINSEIFKPCHNKVSPMPYYEACVSDFCGCDSVGDSECFCTAVAAYSWSCSRAGVCIDWRTPTACPVFCDYYNPPNKKEWHYKPCGDPCLRTCRNCAGRCSIGNLPYSLEGCYPECSADKPYYDEEKRECVSAAKCTLCGPKEKLSLKDSIGNIAMPPTTLPVTTKTKIAVPCYCNINGKLITNGSSEFVTMDTSDWCIYAFCNTSCQTEFSYEECSFKMTTTSKPSMMPRNPCKGTVLSCQNKPPPLVVTKSDSTHTPVSGCTKLNPPRKFQESWKYGSCQVATCLGGGNHIKISDVRCPPQKLKRCINGLPPIKIRTAAGCCEVSECQCTCSGWGNQHYVTFDGSYYNFPGNCSYLLMKPIRPNFQNFWIQMDNHYIAAIDKAVYSMALFIYYNHSMIVLTRGAENGKEGNLVLLNNKEILSSYSKDGIDISTFGQYTVVKIPEIRLLVSYTHLAFYISLPFSTFFNNTEGQCGTCTNKKKDDVMKRNGKIADSFTEMAMDWKVMDFATRNCESGQHPASSPYEMLSSSMATCEAPSVCKLIWNLTECHYAVPPRPYYEACVMDGCFLPQQNIECRSLQAYAALCGYQGICVDWRSKLKGKCELTCPQDQIYKPCGRMERHTCYSGKRTVSTNPPQVDISGILAEGCFCPEGMIQLNDHDSICVSVCGCTRLDGLVKQPGEIWEQDCQICTCSDKTLNITCSPHICPKSPSITCTKEGFVPIVRKHSKDPCCTETVCACDVRSCTMPKKECNLGFELVTATPEDGCCPIYSCVPKNICVSNGIEYQPGSLVPSNSCDECICTETKDPETQINHIQCSPVKCSTECPQGFRYTHEEGKCCGECIQVSCIANFSSGTVVVEVGELYMDSQDKCSQYMCSKTSGQFFLISTGISCPLIDQSRCIPGTIETTPDGCCETCHHLSHNCSVSLQRQYVARNQCKSATPILVSFCKGSCSTYSVYSFVTNKMKHQCTCCRATKYRKMKVVLVCRGRRRIRYSYLHIEECGCVETKCPT